MLWNTSSIGLLKKHNVGYVDYEAYVGYEGYVGSEGRKAVRPSVPVLWDVLLRQTP